MKKILSIIGLIGVVGLFAVPALAAVDAPKTCTLKYNLTSIDPDCTKFKADGVTPNELAVEDYGMCCVMNSLYNITDWIFIILVGIAAIMVLMGAFFLLTAGGSSEKVTTGRQYIIYAAVGLVVAFLAKAIPGVVKVIVGLN